MEERAASIKEKCKKVIMDAGHRLLDARDMVIEEKTDFRNLVTTYDTMTQEHLVAEFRGICPGASFLCEEGDEQSISDEMFIIDPIDGTANFVHGLNLSAIAVAYAVDMKLEWGIVYNPFTDELFEAGKGCGAFLNGRPIKAFRHDLKHSIVAFGTSPYDIEMKEETLGLVSEVMKHSMDVRRLGSAELDLCYTAAGRFGLYFEKRLSPWDLAAGMIIAEEAGAIVTDFEGKTPDFTKKGSVIAGPPQCVSEFMDIIKA